VYVTALGIAAASFCEERAKDIADSPPFRAYTRHGRERPNLILKTEF